MKANELNEAQRRAIVQGFVDSGMSRDRSRLIVDIAAAAAQKGMEACLTHCDLAPDKPAYLSVLATALQLLAADANFGVQAIQMTAATMPGALEATRYVEVPADGGTN